MRRTKQTLYIIICFIFLFTAIPPRPSYAEENYIVTVNGTMASWNEIGPFMRLGRLMTPLGGFGAALGADVKWDADRQEAFIFWQGRYAWMQVSNPTMYYGTYIAGGNGEPLLTDVTAMELPVRPDLEQNRLAVPLAALAGALGGFVEWDADTLTAAITIVPPPPELISTQDEIQPEQPPAEENRGYFKLLTLDETLFHYENDDPFVLARFDSNLPSKALYDILKAAADLKIKVHGLDINKETAVLSLPFAGGTDNGFEVSVFIINGYERVEELGDPDYTQTAEALQIYLETE